MAPTSTPHLSLADQTLDNTLGAVLLGLVGASLLFGFTTLQAYWYYHSYPNDSQLHKCSVAILWVLDAFHLSLVVHAVYTYTVFGFGDSVKLLNIPWSIKLQASVNVLIILIVHSLYAMRVWLLGGYHRGVLGYLVASVVVAGFVIGVAFSYSVYTIETLTELERISWVIDAALGTSTAIDFIITAAMCYYLRKSKGNITRLNSRISVIMQYSLSSGLLTSACSLSTMFTFILLPNTFIFIALEFLVTKLYVGSFIAMLNAREKRLGMNSYAEDTYTQPSWKRPLRSHTTSSFWSPQPGSLTLNVQLPQSPLSATFKPDIIGQAL